MGGRYFITGVQLGILMSEICEEDKMKTIKKVIDYQYIGDKEYFEKIYKKKGIKK